MLVYNMEDYLKEKTKDELIKIITDNKSTQKAVRNAMIKEEFKKYSRVMPLMDCYASISVTHGVSEQWVMKVLKS